MFDIKLLWILVIMALLVVPNLMISVDRERERRIIFTICSSDLLIHCLVRVRLAEVNDEHWLEQRCPLLHRLLIQLDVLDI